MNVRPPAWDKYEAVILLEGMIDIKQHDMPRNIVVERVSQDLRKMARNRGIEIDELFRNVNGIAFQLQSMESAYCGYTVFKPASKLFTEIAGVYKTDHTSYELLLKEATVLATGQADGVKLLAACVLNGFPHGGSRSVFTPFPHHSS